MPGLSGLCPVRLATAEHIEKLSLAAASGSIKAWPVLTVVLEEGKVRLPSEDSATAAASIHGRMLPCYADLSLTAQAPSKVALPSRPAYSSGRCVLCGVPVHSRLSRGVERGARLCASPRRGAPMSPTTRPRPT